jgi:hypothetical protein
MPVKRRVGMKRLLAHIIVRIAWLAIVTVLTDLKSA